MNYVALFTIAAEHILTHIETETLIHSPWFRNGPWSWRNRDLHLHFEVCVSQNVRFCHPLRFEIINADCLIIFSWAILGNKNWSTTCYFLWGKCFLNARLHILATISPNIRLPICMVLIGPNDEFLLTLPTFFY